MSIQRIILSALKNTPTPLIKILAGRPLEIDGNELDPNLHLLAKMAPPSSQDVELHEMRQAVHDTFKNLNGARRRNIHIYDTTIPGKAGELPVRFYEPEHMSDNAPAILFFHQGGLVLMDLDSDDSFCTILADECRAKVISLDYRLCPEHKFPAAHEDADTLWTYVQKNAKQLGINPENVALAGDSAGGLIASVLCQTLKSRKSATIKPKAQLLVYPWVTTEEEGFPSLESCADCFPLNRETMEFFNALVFPDGKLSDHRQANPLKAKSLKGLPPAIIATAGFDPIRDQGDAYAERLKKADVPTIHHRFTNLCHSFLSMGNVSKAAENAQIQLARDLASLLVV